jgi:cysteine desulfurase/selenocysteine lyase
MGLPDSVFADFPILRREVHGRPLRYLDNAATTQKPQVVVDVLRRFYEDQNANVHRGVHHLSEQATLAYDRARERVRKFLNAPSAEEIVFVRGTTEAINLIASTFGRSRVKAGDEVLITALEHHSNLVPWQLLCEEKGATLKVVPVDDRGELSLSAVEPLLTPRTKLFALTHVSNALGTVNPVRELVALAHAHGVPVVVDGAQAVAHAKVDVQALDADFYAFSGHKVYGPTGIGALYGKAKWWEEMPPYQSGGDMIAEVTFEKTTFAPMPARFEAGTPNIAGAIGLEAALGYVERLGPEAIEAHEHQLLEYGLGELAKVPGLRLVGEPAHRAGVISFVVERIHPHDLGTFLDRKGVAVRAGHHCAQPLMSRFGLAGTVRASVAVYNQQADLDALREGLLEARRFFG